MEDSAANDFEKEEVSAGVKHEDPATAPSYPAPDSFPDEAPFNLPDEQAVREQLPTADPPQWDQASANLGPLSVDARHVDSGGVLPQALAFTLSQLNVALDTDALSADVKLAGGRLDSDTTAISGLTADATVTALGRYDVVAHAEGGDIEAVLDLMRQGRPIIVGVERSEFWYTLDDRGDDGSGEPARLGEWRSESDTLELMSAREPDVPLYEISKSAFLARWQEQEAKLVVIDQAPGATGPLPVLVPLVLDAASGLRQLGAD